MAKYSPEFNKKHLKMFANIGCRFNRLEKMDYWRIYYKKKQILYMSESKFKEILELFKIMDEALPKFLYREKILSLQEHKKDLEKTLEDIQL